MSKLYEQFEVFINQAKNVEGKSDDTIKNYRQNFDLLKDYKLKTFSVDLFIEDLTAEFIINFFTYLNNRKRKVGNKYVVRKLMPSSIATIRAKLSTFFEWLIKNSYLVKNPFEDIKHPKVTFTDRRAFTNEEYNKIYLAVSRDIVWGSVLLKIRSITMVMFLSLTGVRREELIGLRLDDLDMNNKILTVRAEISKSKITHFVPLDETLIIQLKEYFEARRTRTTPYLWVSSTEDRNFTEHGAKHFIERLEKVTGLKIFLHRFRHTFAVNHYVANKDLLSLQRMMGHKDVKVTINTYLRWLPDFNLQNQVNLLRISLNKGNEKYTQNRGT